MDKDQEELQDLSFISILVSPISIITKSLHLFIQITLSLILPLSFLFLSNIALSLLFFHHNHGTHLSSSSIAIFYSIKILYLIFLLVLSLLSTSAVVYTVAAIYTSKSDTHFRKLFTVVVPRVWKRLMVTFLCSFAVLFVYHLLLVIVIVFGFLIRDTDRVALEAVLGVVLVVFLVAFLVGLVYISVIWQLANVVTVLEESCGMTAMAKSRGLIKGKIGVSMGVFVLVNVGMVLVKVPFDEFVVMGNGEIGVFARVVLGAVCLVMVCLIFLFGLVVQTVVYFVCKSYHREVIDKASLADHLEVYLGEYVPLKSKDIQLEQVYV